nr:MAG TPA: hypothetical protein [Caudoviricetes sp.]
MNTVYSCVPFISYRFIVSSPELHWTTPRL